MPTAIDSRSRIVKIEVQLTQSIVTIERRQTDDKKKQHDSRGVCSNKFMLQVAANTNLYKATKATFNIHI